MTGTRWPAVPGPVPGPVTCLKAVTATGNSHLDPPSLVPGPVVCLASSSPQVMLHRTVSIIVPGHGILRIFRKVSEMFCLPAAERGLQWITTIHLWHVRRRGVIILGIPERLERLPLCLSFLGDAPVASVSR